MELSEVSLATLNGKYIIVTSPTVSGNVYVENGHLNQGFGVVNGEIYHIDFSTDQIKDPTKGDLVVTLDAPNKTIYWRQTHEEQQPYEAWASLHSSKFGGDAGAPLLEALEAYVRGTFNLTGYDTRLVTMADLIGGVTTTNGSSTGTEEPVNVAAVPTSDGATITAK